MTVPSGSVHGARVDLNSLTTSAGRLALSFEVGNECHALFAGTLVSDILREEISLLPDASPDVVLHVHVGDVAPILRANAPCLIIRPGSQVRDSLLALTQPPWNAVRTVSLPRLRWASGDSALLEQQDGLWWLNANLPEVYGREAQRHETADSDMVALLGSLLAMRDVLARIPGLPGAQRRVLSLLTVDAEDQQRYFINAEGRCSNIRGRPDGDMQFAASCRTIMDRCEAAGVKSVFMVTGDEIHPEFVDAFGDPLIGREDNRRVLDEMPARGHDVACHGFDHEWWIAHGRSTITPMSLGQKLRYFIETSGDMRTLLGLARFLIVYGRRISRARAATRIRSRTVGEPFTIDDMRRDFDRWTTLTGHCSQRLFIRYPGYVRSAATVHHLDDRYSCTVDSSDLYQPEWGLPAFPYRLLTVRDGVLRRTRIIEIPCIWIDKLLRTRDMARVKSGLEQLARLAAMPDSVLSFITHTKVLGATWGHCHVYLHDPLKGMALPACREAWEAFAKFLRDHTRSSNWRDLQQELFGISA
jgi:hypothetical protein